MHVHGKKKLHHILLFEVVHLAGEHLGLHD